ncbi:MAG TPA: hypothetical protein VNM14_25015 [Planctomycetota bacterium]|jgi:hypothetical protein|nr:hypothetical protein [Planctomycetota bacterium]
MDISRRTFLGQAAGATLATWAGPQDALPPVRAITKGPKFHWFGYYDKLEIDPGNRFVLGTETSFEHRSPTPEDTIKIGMVDLQDGDRWIELGETRAWCWQQGCMLQWLPGSASEVIWNDRDGDRFVSHILDVTTRKKRTLPGPIYAISPDARTAISPDFRRLHDTRPGYGYAGVPDPNKDVLAPGDAGIWKMDLKTGERNLIFSIADALKVPWPQGSWEGAKHWFNHLLFAPEGARFCFLNRWKAPGDKVHTTRMITMNRDGSDPFVLIAPPFASHFIWRDPSHILCFARHASHGDRFYLYEDRTDKVEVVGPTVMTVDGHCTYLPGNQWILNDTYPDAQRMQNPHLYHVATGKRHPLGHFLSPREYGGEWRCDTHPRFSPDGKKVVIDSPHGGGRQLYLIDISGIVG